MRIRVQHFVCICCSASDSAHMLLRICFQLTPALMPMLPGRAPAARGCQAARGVDQQTLDLGILDTSAALSTCAANHCPRADLAAAHTADLEAGQSPDAVRTAPARGEVCHIFWIHIQEHLHPGTMYARHNSECALRLMQVCRRVPKGRVSTYGALAKVLNSSPRAVGQVRRTCSPSLANQPCCSPLHVVATCPPLQLLRQSISCE